MTMKVAKPEEKKEIKVHRKPDSAVHRNLKEHPERAVELVQGRMEFVDGCERLDEGEKALAKEWLDHVLVGGKVKPFLVEHSISWPELNDIIYRMSYELYVATSLVRDKLKLAMAEDELFRRAVEGVEQPVYQLGKLVGHVREYSDKLLELYLKSHAPEKYMDRQSVEHSGAVLKINIDGVKRGAPIDV